MQNTAIDPLPSQDPLYINVDNAILESTILQLDLKLYEQFI